MLEATVNFSKSVGIAGGVAILLTLIWMSQAHQGIEVKDLYDLKVTGAQLKDVFLMLVALALFIYQFSINEDKANKEREFVENRIALKSNERDAIFWSNLHHELLGHTAVLSWDDQFFASRIVESAYRLREEITRALTANSEASGYIQKYGDLLRASTMHFLKEVEDIEKKAGISLKGANINADELGKACQARKHDARACRLSFAEAHNRWRGRTRDLAQTASEIFGLVVPDFDGPKVKGATIP